MISEDIQPAVKLLEPSQLAEGSDMVREKQAFEAMYPDLLQHYEGKYVAIYQQQVVDHDPDKVTLALRVYRTHGYKPIFVHYVSRHRPVQRSMRSPRLPSQR
ncbi:MAG: hypothetical protein ETSY1_40345 [Candidatus Entotheonella factor]|uniref:DUF5678 domain-containing protein n=1 Tax=Entotheonella factor TaxID=1429438 RepID=W4L5L6_ENTF1|nr:MAG: hypothetical protein ETSY1_40345 [Candidatus Entotheonella factor]